MKIITVKKSLIAALAVIVAIGAALGIYCGTASSAAASSGEKIIVIDAGHGGVDAGVLGVNTSVKESDINLAISRKLKGCFTAAGFTVVMTRTNNGGLYGTYSSGFKMRDMKRRKAIIEECAADMVISIHQNRCSIPSRRGGQVFFDGGSESGKSLAACIQTELNGMKECVRQYSPLAGDYYMLKCTKSPSVIVECGFLSNAEDEKLLTDDEYQSNLAYAIFKGAVAYYC